MPRLDQPGPPPRERTFWEVLPRRNFRRVLFLVAVLLVVLFLKRTGGGSLHNILNAFGPSPGAAPPAGAAGSFQRLNVVPGGGAAGHEGASP
jgi:hypothetical protein